MMSMDNNRTSGKPDNDLEGIAVFFQAIAAEEGQKKRIKALAISKIQRETEVEKHRDESSEQRNMDLPGKRSPYAPLLAKLKSLRWGRYGRIAAPMAVILLLTALGSSLAGNSGPMLGVRSSMSLNSAKQGVADMVGVKNEVVMMSAPEQAKLMDTSLTGGIAPLPQDSQTPPPEMEPMNRKITYQIHATLQVEDVLKSHDAIKKKVEALGGYVVESSKQLRQGAASAGMTLKIPTDKTVNLIGWFPEIGKVLNESSRADDITNQYYDAENQLRNWESQEKRYLEILKNAKTVEEILKIESALNNTRLQIDQLKGQLRLWSNQVAYSTVQLNLQTPQNQVTVDDPWQPVSFEKTWQAARAAVLKTVSTTWNLLNYFLVGIAYATPYLILGGTAYGLYRFRKRRRKQDEA